MKITKNNEKRFDDFILKKKIAFDKNSLYSEKSALKGKCITFNIKNLGDDIETFDEFIKNKKVHELLYNRIY